MINASHDKKELNAKLADVPLLLASAPEKDLEQPPLLKNHVWEQTNKKFIANITIIQHIKENIIHKKCSSHQNSFQKATTTTLADVPLLLASAPEKYIE